jgi:hypothetical protein
MCAASTRALLSISTGSCLTTLLTALILFQTTAACLPTWRTGWDHSISTIMRSWRKVSKHSWAHRWHAFLTQAWSSFRMLNLFSSLLVLLTANWSYFLNSLVCICTEINNSWLSSPDKTPSRQTFLHLRNYACSTPTFLPHHM